MRSGLVRRRHAGAFPRLRLARDRPHRRPRSGRAGCGHCQRQTAQRQATLIVCRTTIGAGAPTRGGSAKAHGEPLGADEIAATRQALGWNHPPFEIPAEIRAQWDARASGAQRQGEWQARFNAYRSEFPELAAEFERRMSGALPDDWQDLRASVLEQFAQATENVATRKASQQVLALLGPRLPELLGGSADLTGSNLT
ncbi:transketolase, partial [mine drainage metagenome]